jgi:hypothetical protein
VVGNAPRKSSPGREQEEQKSPCFLCGILIGSIPSEAYDVAERVEALKVDSKHLNLVSTTLTAQPLFPSVERKDPSVGGLQSAYKSFCEGSAFWIFCRRALGVEIFACGHFLGKSRGA